MDSISIDTPYATNDEVARILFHVASILEMVDDNVYRVFAYRRAAFRVLMLPRQLAEYYLHGEEPPLHGVGDRIRGRLRELINTGRMGAYESLKDELGEPVVSLLALNGVGPKTALRLVKELQVESLEDLADAARHGRIRQLRGFGEKREARLGEQAEAFLAAS